MAVDGRCARCLAIVAGRLRPPRMTLSEDPDTRSRRPRAPSPPVTARLARVSSLEPPATAPRTSPLRRRRRPAPTPRAARRDARARRPHPSARASVRQSRPPRSRSNLNLCVIPVPVRDRAHRVTACRTNASGASPQAPRGVSRPSPRRSPAEPPTPPSPRGSSPASGPAERVAPSPSDAFASASAFAFVSAFARVRPPASAPLPPGGGVAAPRRAPGGAAPPPPVSGCARSRRPAAPRTPATTTRRGAVRAHGYGSSPRASPVPRPRARPAPRIARRPPPRLPTPPPPRGWTTRRWRSPPTAYLAASLLGSSIAARPGATAAAAATPPRRAHPRRPHGLSPPAPAEAHTRRASPRAPPNHRRYRPRGAAPPPGASATSPTTRQAGDGGGSKRGEAARRARLRRVRAPPAAENARGIARRERRGGEKIDGCSWSPNAPAFGEVGNAMVAVAAAAASTPSPACARVGRPRAVAASHGTTPRHRRARATRLGIAPPAMTSASVVGDGSDVSAAG